MIGSEDAGKAGRRAVEDGRLHAPDAAPPALEQSLWCRPLGHQERGRADGERKSQRIAEAIGEEELGGREADVGLLQAEDRLAIKLGRPVRVGVRMHGSLRPAGRTRRIEPERGIVGLGAGRLHERRLAGEKVVELDLAEVERLGGARHYDRVDLMVRLCQRSFQRRLDRAADKRCLGPRMFEHVGEIIGGHQRVDRHRRDAREHRAQKRDRPIGAVLHEQEHALLAPDPCALETRGEPPRPLVELTVGDHADIVDERRLHRAFGIGGKQMEREVEHLRRRFNGACGHRRLLGRARSRAADGASSSIGGAQPSTRRLACLGNMQYCA